MKLLLLTADNQLLCDTIGEEMIANTESIEVEYTNDAMVIKLKNPYYWWLEENKVRVIVENWEIMYEHY